MARCSVCGKYLGMSYEQLEGKKYCDECYRTAVLHEVPAVSNENSSAGASRIQREAAQPETPVIAQVFSAFAWIEWMLGSISAFILGSRLGFATTIGGLAIVFAAGCIPMGFSTIIRLLAEIAWNTRRKR